MGRRREADPAVPDPVQERVREFEAFCRSRGLPVTIQRRAVYQAVVECREHPSADEVHQRVSGRVPNLSRSTVYRALEAMVGLGVLRRVNHGGVAVRYDANLQRHHHLVCSRCSRVVDYSNPSWDRLPVPRDGLGGFEVLDFSVHLMGICAECSQPGRG